MWCDKALTCSEKCVCLSHPSGSWICQTSRFFFSCRIRKGVPSEARVVARVLPPLLLDFFPAQEIMNKVIGEFLSSQQPHPELMAQVLFKVNKVLGILINITIFIYRTYIAFFKNVRLSPHVNCCATRQMDVCMTKRTLYEDKVCDFFTLLLPLHR